MTATKEPEIRSSGDWRFDRRTGHIAQFVPAEPLGAGKTDLTKGEIEGPADAFVLFGLPYQGDPWRTTRMGPGGKPVEVEPYVDRTQISTELGGVRLEWIEWDPETGCNVYRRVA